MVSTWVSFTSLYSAVLMLLMGVGLLGTLISLQMTLEGYPAQITGLIMSAYYAGAVLGSLTCHRLIQKVGHIRAFAAFAAIATAAIMAHGVHISPATWAGLRLVTGVSATGLYMVIESWLSECTVREARGRVFSVYMVLTYAGVGIGQLLLNLGDAGSPNLFFLTGALVSLCLVPVVTTHSVHPELPEPRHFNAVALFRRAPLGMLGCLTAGLMSSAFYALGPVFGSQIGLSVPEVSVFMATTILGGLLLQWPVGSLSDRFDRTLVLAVMTALIAAVGLAAAIAVHASFSALLGVAWVFGGMVFTVYPVSVARTHDLFEPQEVVAVSSVLLLCFGIGATAGPILASIAMGVSGRPEGFFLYFTAVGGLYAMIALYARKHKRVEIVPVEDQVAFVPMKGTSPVTMGMDPRSEEESPAAEPAPTSDPRAEAGDTLVEVEQWKETA